MGGNTFGLIGMELQENEREEPQNPFDDLLAVGDKEK